MPDSSFSSRVVRSFLYSGIGNTVSRVLNVVALLVVLKLITPEAFGVASIVLALFAIVQSVTELGLGVALVQAQDITRREIDSLFWLSLFISAGVYVLILLGAPLVARFYDEPQLTALVQVQGLAVPLFALYFVPKNLLVKDLSFGKLAVIENAALLASAAAMVVVASLGYGAWAIIVGELGQRAGQMVLCQAVRPYRPAWCFHFQEIKPRVTFGLYATGSRLLYNFYVNADYLIVGKAFGPEAVGLYTFAYRVISDTVRTLASSVNQVAYPAFARLQDQTERLRRYFFAIARASLALIGLVLVVVALYIGAVLEMGGYEQWLGAVPLIYVFALVGVIHTVSPLVPQLLNAVGEARLNFFYSLSNAIFMPVAFVVGAQFGLMGVAWSWLAAYPAVVLLLFYFGARSLKMPFSAFLGRLSSGLVALAPIVAFGLTIRWALPRLTGSMLLVAVVGVLLTVTVGLSIAYLRERETIALLRSTPSTPEA